MKVLALMLAVALPAFGQVYKWVDENGVTHFGSRPPEAVEHEEIEIRDANSSAAPSKDLSRTFDRRQTDRQYEAARKAASEASATGAGYICTGAKNRVINLKERWDGTKTQGYTQSQKQQYEQRIREAERHRDNVCR